MFDSYLLAGFSRMISLVLAPTRVSYSNNCRQYGLLGLRMQACCPVGKSAIALILVACAACLQGCDMEVHGTSAWEAKAPYMLSYEFTPAGATKPVVNSCNVPGLLSTQQCGGNGVCIKWPTSVVKPTLSFCMCSRDWADPECRTHRKSQAKAYFYALFGGFFGIDRFYLGEWPSGLAKLSTLGGCGLWWVFDIVRIGSSPVYAEEYRLAADLPHSLHMLITVPLFTSLGYVIFGIYGSYRVRTDKKKALMNAAEQAFFIAKSKTVELPEESGGPSKQRPYITLTPIGLGVNEKGEKAKLGDPGYGSMGMTPPTEVPGGPYRNWNYYVENGGMQIPLSYASPQLQNNFASSESFHTNVPVRAAVTPPKAHDVDTRIPRTFSFPAGDLPRTNSFPAAPVPTPPGSHGTVPAFPRQFTVAGDDLDNAVFGRR